MNERQQLKVSYDKAKEDLENATADVANLTIRIVLGTHQTGQSSADTDLCKTVATLAKSHVDLPKARANLERARANCHRTMLELKEFDEANANQWLTQSSWDFVHSAEWPQASMGHGKEPIGSFAVPHRDEFLVPNDKPARALLVKHTVMLFALVLAFLQYYILDIRLQIERLPTGGMYVASQQLNQKG